MARRTLGIKDWVPVRAADGEDAHTAYVREHGPPNQWSPMYDRLGEYETVYEYWPGEKTPRTVRRRKR